MSFASYEYLALLVTVVLAAAVLPWRPRLLLLLAASYVFYCWDVPWYGLVLLSSTLVDFVAGLRMEASSSPRTRRAWLLGSVTVNLGLLAYFKYAASAVEGARPMLETLGLGVAPLRVVLPVGISFYTFQSLSYTIDVYRGRVKAARDLPLFAAYVAFFPQLVAGPIERAERLIPQLATRPRLTAEHAWDGLCLILSGLAKKLVLADRLTLAVGAAFGDPAAHDGWQLLVALVIMPMALYFDFGGYTDIARGSALLLGVELSRNFDFPLVPTSPSDFWSRWHRTLTAWVRDYVFRPLGGIRRGAPARTAFNVILSMALVGLWHGAAWTFVLWGLWHGVLLAVELVARSRWRLPREPRTTAGGLAAFVASASAIALSAPLFFCPDVRTAARFWLGLFTRGWGSWGAPDLSALALFAVLVFLVQTAGRRWDLPRAWRRLPGPAQGVAMAVVLYAILFGALPSAQRFVYYRF